LRTNQPPTAARASSGVASASGPGEHAGELELEVERPGMRRPPHVLAVGEQHRVVGDVERRRLVEAPVGLELRERPARHALERRDDLPGRRREEVLDEHPGRRDHVRLPEHERAHRPRPERQRRRRRVRRDRHVAAHAAEQLGRRRADGVAAAQEREHVRRRRRELRVARAGRDRSGAQRDPAVPILDQDSVGAGS
jgi:hypothetical protein